MSTNLTLLKTSQIQESEDPALQKEKEKKKALSSMRALGSFSQMDAEPRTAARSPEVLVQR